MLYRSASRPRSGWHMLHHPLNTENSHSRSLSALSCFSDLCTCSAYPHVPWPCARVTHETQQTPISWSWEHLSHLHSCDSRHLPTSPRYREVFHFRNWQILGSEPHPPCSPCWKWWREHGSASFLSDGVWHCGGRGDVAAAGRSVFTRCLATRTPPPSPGSKRAATRVQATQ